MLLDELGKIFMQYGLTFGQYLCGGCHRYAWTAINNSSITIVMPEINIYTIHVH